MRDGYCPLPEPVAGRSAGEMGSYGRPDQGAWRTPCRAGGADADPAGVVLYRLLAGMLEGTGETAFESDMEAGQRVLGNRGFMHWVEQVRSRGRGAAGQALPAQGQGAPLQLMGKKKKPQQAAAPPASGTQEHAGAGMTGDGGAAPEGKKKKKSRVQVALNRLRGEGVAPFGDYIGAEIGEAALLRTLVERITRAEDLQGVRVEALAMVEARLRLLAGPLPAHAGSGVQAPETAVLTPAETMLSPRELGLFVACDEGNAGELRRLLRHVNVNINVGLRGETMLCNAVFNGHANIVRELLPRPGIDVNLAQRQGATPLCLAAQRGDTGIARLLLDKAGINVNLKTLDETTPLFVAVACGHLELVELLLAAPGINVNPATAEGGTPLMMAIQNRDEKMVDRLLTARGIDVDVRTKDGASALFFAVKENLPGVVEQLVRRGADVNLALSAGSTPLHQAAGYGYLEVVRILLQAPGIRVNQLTVRGTAPVGIAARGGHKEIVRLILKKGAAANIKSSDGLTALHTAALHGHTAIVEMLLHAGADVDAEVQDPDNEILRITPVDTARIGGHRQVVSVLTAHRWRRQAARRLEQLSITGAPGAGVGTPPPLPGTEVEGGPDATGASVCPIPPRPSLQGQSAPGTEPPTHLAQAQDALRQEVLDKLRADNLDPLAGIRLLEAVNDAGDLDSLCTLYNRLAHIERRKERARRRGESPIAIGPVALAAAGRGPEAPVFALEEQAALDADRAEVEIKRHLGQAYHRFVSQAVNDMEFGRGKRTTGYPDLWHASAGVAGAGSCSVFYYTDAAQNRIRIVGIGHHVGRAAYRLDYAAPELGEVGRILRIA